MARASWARLSPAGPRAAARQGLLLEGALLASFAAAWIGAGEATPGDHARLVLLALAGAAMGVQASLSLALGVPNVATVALTASFAQLARLAGLGTLGRMPRVGDGEPSALLLLGLCTSYLVTALAVALLPATPALAAAPLALLALAAAAGARS